MTTRVAGLPARAEHRIHEIVTPEGVTLHFAIARAGDRLGAFLIDALIIIVGTILLVALAASLSGPDSKGWLWAFVFLAIFLLINFYFIWFESRGRGTTPGKRRMGIRIMDAEGGTLATGAIVVRNVMRVLEVHLPLIALLAPEQFWEGAPGWARLIACGWLLVIAGMPLFNRSRLRVGDIVAGTVVVTAPALSLDRDVGAKAPAAKEQDAPRPFSFTAAQLDVYGNYELQVLEDLLRRKDGGTEAALHAVADRIARKIRWPRRLKKRESRLFLTEFYAALRGRLEQRMLLGKRKKDKFSKDE